MARGRARSACGETPDGPDRNGPSRFWGQNPGVGRGRALWSSREGGFPPLPAAGGSRWPLSCAPAQVSAPPSCSSSPSPAAHGVGGGERELSPGVARVSSMWGPEDWSGGPLDARRGLALMLPCWATLEVMSRLRASGTRLSKWLFGGRAELGCECAPWSPPSALQALLSSPLGPPLAWSHHSCTARGQAGVCGHGHSATCRAPSRPGLQTGCWDMGTDGPVRGAQRGDGPLLPLTRLSTGLCPEAPNPSPCFSVSLR